jgi:hypothetical protein
MPTREDRVAEFSAHPPPQGVNLEVLCEDHVGTYALPFSANGPVVAGSMQRPTQASKAKLEVGQCVETLLQIIVNPSTPRAWPLPNSPFFSQGMESFAVVFLLLGVCCHISDPNWPAKAGEHVENCALSFLKLCQRCTDLTKSCDGTSPPRACSTTLFILTGKIAPV